MVTSSSEVASNGMFFLCVYARNHDWPFQQASQQCKPYQNSMDGTRVIRTFELYEKEYLVREAFPADVRLFPENQKNKSKSVIEIC